MFALKSSTSLVSKSLLPKVGLLAARSLSSTPVVARNVMVYIEYLLVIIYNIYYYKELKYK